MIRAAEVVVQGERVPVDRLRVEAGVAPCVEGDLGQLLGGGAVAVHVRLGVHGDPAGGGGGAERQRPLGDAAGVDGAAGGLVGRHQAGAAPAALGAALPDGPEAQHVVRHPGADGHAGLHHRAQLTRGLDATVVPVDLQPERVDDVVGARAVETSRLRHGPGVGRDAVDVLEAETRVVHRGKAGVEREDQGVPMEPPPDVALTDPGDRAAPLGGVLGDHDAPSRGSGAGSKKGSQTSPPGSSRWAKTTCTSIPIRTDSGAQLTRLVVSRSPTCSTSSTSPMT